MEIKYKGQRLDEYELSQLHDAVLGVFGIRPSNKEIGRLIELCDDWDGETDTLGREGFVNEVANHFVGMDVPTFGSTREHKEKFWLKVEGTIPAIERYLKGDGN
jgi:hypothetical protein